MAFRKWNAVIEELRVQRERSEREWREQREHSDREWREQRERSEREWALTRQEHRLNRRAYEEGLALCARLIDRVDGMFDANVRALQELRQEIRDHREEGRAQTQALLRVIDRMDGLDGGSQSV